LSIDYFFNKSHLCDSVAIVVQWNRHLLIVFNPSSAIVTYNWLTRLIWSYVLNTVNKTSHATFISQSQYWKVGQYTAK